MGYLQLPATSTKHPEFIDLYPVKLSWSMTLNRYYYTTSKSWQWY